MAIVFLSLPPEVRQIIYQYAPIHRKDYVFLQNLFDSPPRGAQIIGEGILETLDKNAQCSNENDGLNLGFLSTCKQIYREAIHYLYNSCNFRSDPRYSASSPTAAVRMLIEAPARFDLMRHVTYGNTSIFGAFDYGHLPKECRDSIQRFCQAIRDRNMHLKTFTMKMGILAPVSDVAEPLSKMIQDGFIEELIIHVKEMPNIFQVAAWKHLFTWNRLPKDCELLKVPKKIDDFEVYKLKLAKK
ncbi:uncharacterized protein KY384_008637 [Bacidia gigantensis]|uniref:uncharacterized protein n=1 Tax=Bacidia gigantensis TaxID=2732470 RepID=UPI001D045F15|nr:uncharacterized protein KY384_008637 [Bacidia gigantensis]KAG8527207.1 hypothetical protein KY384_008637 [Bacidia gigantensis]